MRAREKGTVKKGNDEYWFLRECLFSLLRTDTVRLQSLINKQLARLKDSNHVT